ncbi:hypothetical protein HPB50_026777 [Hyalomma asiaticum]|uniref:Uncharacterized protein n=1 Tax=Hyalomma asiaticum TaxID=266040 RepID=A0ACB7SU46_HYAAI|nr:hypothetical protein HPB50_026777 [Hyalomma asiaticum]
MQREDLSNNASHRRSYIKGLSQNTCGARYLQTVMRPQNPLPTFARVSGYRATFEYGAVRRLCRKLTASLRHIASVDSTARKTCSMAAMEIEKFPKLAKAGEVGFTQRKLMTLHPSKRPASSDAGNGAESRVIVLREPTCEAVSMAGSEGPLKEGQTNVPCPSAADPRASVASQAVEEAERRRQRCMRERRRKNVRGNQSGVTSSASIISVAAGGESRCMGGQPDGISSGLVGNQGARRTIEHGERKKKNSKKRKWRKVHVVEP